MNDAAIAPVPVIRCGGRVRSQPEAQQRAGRLAAAVAAAGIGRGDRVAVMARNDIEFLEASLAIATAGGNPVPVNTRWTAPEVAHVLADAKVRLVFAHTEFVPVAEAASAAAGVAPLIVEIGMPAGLLGESGLAGELGEPTGRHPLLEEWIAAQAEPLGHLEGAISDSMGLIYTSGTTGRPKGVVRERMTPQQLLAIAGATAQRMGLTPGGEMLVAGPLYHASPNAVAVLALRMGTNITIMPRWDSARFLRHIHEQRVQQAKIVPTMLSRLLSLPADVRERYDTSSLTHLIHSAAPCPPAIKRAAIDWFGDALSEFYGSSESGPLTWIRGSEWLAHPGSVGRPADGSAVLVADADGKELPAGEIGRVYVRGPEYWPAFEYLGLGAPGSAVDGMIWVGDLGRFDEDGYLYLTGRDSEVVIRGGVNIYPAEIEAALLAVDGIEDAAVVGIPDTTGDLGETVAAHILPRPGAELTAAGITAALRGQLASYKIPSHLEIVAELPRDDNGKIYKQRVRELLTKAGTGS
ncbi:AMP-binding protein [Nocardia sp. NPDC088792]|uniref:AMP-binding protein n=1 Tax=Nocardia sp. NPDC088792 TaxID=3364332 RepID=UPI003825FB66